MASTLTREKNAEKQRRYRANRRAREQAEANQLPLTGGESQTPGSIVPDTGPVVLPGEGVEVEVKAPEPSPALSLKDRFMQRLQGKAPTVPTPTKKKTGGSKKAADPNLLTTVLPTVVASLIAVYAQQLLPDEYKPCAPTKEEISGVLGPLFDIVGRRVEVVGKASQDAIDLMNSLICAFMYGTRAYITYIDIKKTKENPAYAPQREPRVQQYAFPPAHEPEPASLSGGLRAYQAETHGHYGNGYSGTPSPAAEPSVKNDAEWLNLSAEDGDTEGKSTEAALIANLFSRDKQGRQRLGLLPAGV